jgi:streptomycin 6-kinase
VKDWGLTLGSALAGGNSAYVAEVTTGDGQAAVLKVAIAGYEPLAGEVRTLELAAGRGYARLLQADLGRGAMLVERLGAPLSAAGLSVDAQMEVICGALRRAWQPAANAVGLSTGLEKADWHTDFLRQTWPELGKPCSQSLVELALAFAARRRAAHDPPTARLLHGDPHEDNALADPLEPGGYRFVDPDGLVAEPAYDLSVLMRGWTEELLAGDPLAAGLERCARLAELTGAPMGAIWEWGLVERVSTGLLLAKLGAPDRSRDMLAVAEAWAKAPA